MLPLNYFIDLSGEIIHTSDDVAATQDLWVTYGSVSCQNTST